MDAPATRRARLPHLPGLDGLRGLAVLAVLLFHDGRLPGGYLGVDLFFVLSGFLITRNLVAEHASSGTIDLRAFWVRRARRLFPALIALVVVVGAAAPLLASAARARIRADGLAALFYVANWHSLAAERSYWDLFAAPSPFEHTWSLAIEEQFYIVWPLVAAVVLRASRPRLALGLVSTALVIASGLALTLAFEHGGSARAYLGTDTRAAAILSGAALACVLSGRAPLPPRLVRGLDLAGGVGLAWLALAFARLDGRSPFVYRGGLWLTEIAALALVACASQPGRSRIARLLGVGPLAWIGLVSYGLYLVHWPLFGALASGRFGLSGAALSAVRCGLALALAAISYRWLEEPIRRRGLPLGLPWLVGPASFAAAAAVLVVGTSIERDGARSQAPPRAAGRGAAPAGEATTPGSGARLLVLGDSVAQTLGESLAAIAPGEGVEIVDRGVVDCSVLDGVLPTRSVDDRAPRGGNCADRWPADVAEVRPDATLVVLGGGFLASAEIEGTWRWTCDPAFDAAYAGELAGRIHAMATGAGRVVVARVPYPVGGWRNPTLDARTDCFNAVLEDVARRVPDATLLDLAGWMCPDAACALESEGDPIRPDGLHFQGRGAETTARWVLESVSLAHSRRLPASHSRPAL